MSSNPSCSFWRAKLALRGRSLFSLGNKRLYRHLSHAHDPSGLFLFTGSAALPVHLRQWPFHCCFPDFCLLVLFWIPTKVREHTNYSPKDKSVAQIKRKVCSSTRLFFCFFFFSPLYLARRCRALFLWWEVCLSSYFSPWLSSPLPLFLLQFSIASPSLARAACSVPQEIVWSCTHTHRQSVPGNPKRTEKAASLLGRVASACLHISTGAQALLTWQKQTKGTFFLAPGWTLHSIASGEKKCVRCYFLPFFKEEWSNYFNCNA